MGVATSNKKLNQIASAQHGYFTAKQAKACGFSNRLQSYHCRSGNWRRCEYGLYRLAGFADSQEADFMRWVLWSRNIHDQPQAVVSHYSALALHQLWPTEPATVHLTVPHSFRKPVPPGGVIHKASLPLSVLESHHGFMVTNLYRTLKDLRGELERAGRWSELLQQALLRGALAPEAAGRLGQEEPDQTEPAAPAAMPEPAQLGGAEAVALTELIYPEQLRPLVPAVGPPAAPETGKSAEALVSRERIFAMIRARTHQSRPLSRRRQAGFTLVELLVVMAIISVLAGMLLPALEQASKFAKKAACANNQRQFGLAHGQYQSDFSGFLGHCVVTDLGDLNDGVYYGWLVKISPYLGYAKYVKPVNMPGSVYTCAENPKGEFNGNLPSFGVSAKLGSETGGVCHYPAYKIDQFSTPSGKAYTFDGSGYRVRTVDFYSLTGPGNLGLIPRHPDGRANVGFLDMHVKAYGSPPLPLNYDGTLAAKWLAYDQPVPSGL